MQDLTPLLHVNGEAKAALFGSGQPDNPAQHLATQLIQNVWIGSPSYTDRLGYHAANPYKGINDVLGTLGFSTVIDNTNPILHHDSFKAHQTHFHIDLRAPDFVPITDSHNLLADSFSANQAVPVASDAPIADAQSLLDQVKADLNLTQGEVNMFIPDMPNVPPQNVPVMIAQANQAQSNDVTTTRTLGVCIATPNELYSASNGISPVSEAGFYLKQYEHREVNYTDSGVITVLQQPKHGILRLVNETDRGTLFDNSADPLNPGRPVYAYLPETGYEGKDSATLLVETGGLKVTVEYYFQAISGVIDNEGSSRYCAPKGTFWKISTTLNSDGTNTLTSIEYQSPIIDVGTTTIDAAALASTLGSNILSTLSIDPSLVTLNIADLPGGAVGQTVGTNITLDDNAAGNNWFIDTTPADNSEFLPTSNPNEWVAKAGSDAAGKMDMLSVLLHEYGHALGIEHSAASHDYMGTTLTVGVRRLPSATELALMQQLIAQAKGEMIATTPSPTGGGQDVPFPTLPISLGGLAFAGLLRPNRYGSLSIDLAAPATQYEAAANATFTNLDTATAWQTQGSVDINPSSFDTSGRTVVSSATLNEVSTSQTRLSQVFMLNDSDRYLSFTLAGSVLDNPVGAPEDAFEVALLDASTGASVVSGDGLMELLAIRLGRYTTTAKSLVMTRTDAFLNLQGDGTQNAADCVTCIYNADGSRNNRGHNNRGQTTISDDGMVI